MIILDSMSLAAVIRQRIHGLFFSGLTVKAYNNSIFYSTTTKNIWMAFWWLKRTVKKVFELLVPHSENNFSFCKPFTLLYSVSSYANFYALSFVSLAYPFFCVACPCCLPGFGLCPGWDLLMRGAASCFVMHSSGFLLWFVAVFF